MEELSVKKLRQDGNKVRVMHIREHLFLSSMGTIKTYLNPVGGKTRLEITMKDGQNLVGESKCNLSDNYNKKLGVSICLERAFSEYNFI